MCGALSAPQEFWLENGKQSGAGVGGLASVFGGMFDAGFVELWSSKLRRAQLQEAQFTLTCSSLMGGR